MAAPLHARRGRRSITRETPEERYRRVAVELAHLPTSNGLPEAPFLAARVTFSDVAEELGITRPALYRLWPSQYDFWVDLTRYMVYEIDYSQPGHEMPWNIRHPRKPPTTPPLLGDDEVDTAMSTLANAVQDVVFDDLRVLIRAASLGYPDIEDLGDIRQHVEAKRIGLLAADINWSLAALGRVASRPSEIEIAASLWCLADGLAVLHHLLPEQCAGRPLVDFGHGPDAWTLLALAVRTIYLGLSVPRPPGDPSPPLGSAYEIPTPPRVWTPAQVEALDTATQLFVESITGSATVVAGPTVLGYLTVARVASLARVSRRTIYNVWPTREALLADVLHDLLAEGSRHQRDVLDANQASGLGALTDLLVGSDDPDSVIDPTLAFLIEIHDERTRTTLAAAHRELIVDLSERVRQHLRAVGRHPVDGITIDDLGLLWAALIQGGRRLRRASPTMPLVLAATAEAIVRELTVADGSAQWS